MTARNRRNPQWRARKPRQRLHRDYPACLKLKDRLEDNEELILPTNAPDSLRFLVLIPPELQVALDRVARHFREGPHHLEIPVVQGMVGEIAEAAEGAVHPPVREAYRHAQMSPHGECFGRSEER